MVRALWKRESVRFFVTGAGGGAVYYAVFFLCSDLGGHPNYLWWGFIASVVNYLFNFYVQNPITFNRRPEDNTREQVAQFVVLAVVLTFVNLVLLYGLTGSLQYLCVAIHCPIGYAKWLYAATPFLAGLGVMYVNYIIGRKIYVPKPRTPALE